MTEYYFINQRIVTLENSAVLGEVDSDIELEPVTLLSGAILSPAPSYIHIALTPTSGDFYPDVFNSLFTLFSNNVKKCLDTCGIQNIQYFPVELMDAKSKTINTDYWLANIIGRISCLDVEHSDVKKNVFGTGFKFKSFTIDEQRTMGAEVFRLHEDGRLIILSERVYKALANTGLTGVVLENTRNYDGYGI
jgi:hypothetical protein